VTYNTRFFKLVEPLDKHARRYPIERSLQFAETRIPRQQSGDDCPSPRLSK
jgi:hypothetical protein